MRRFYFMVVVFVCVLPTMDLSEEIWNLRFFWLGVCCESDFCSVFGHVGQRLIDLVLFLFLFIWMAFQKDK